MKTCHIISDFSGIIIHGPHHKACYHQLTIELSTNMAWRRSPVHAQGRRWCRRIVMSCLRTISWNNNGPCNKSPKISICNEVKLTRGIRVKEETLELATRRGLSTALCLSATRTKPRCTESDHTYLDEGRRIHMVPWFVNLQEHTSSWIRYCLPVIRSSDPVQEW